MLGFGQGHVALELLMASHSSSIDSASTHYQPESQTHPVLMPSSACLCACVPVVLSVCLPASQDAHCEVVNSTHDDDCRW